MAFLLIAIMAVLFLCSREKEKDFSKDNRPVDFSLLAKKVKPSVVNISALEVYGSPYPDLFYRFFGRKLPGERVEQKLGSGVIISSSGLILTNYHLIGGAKSIRVTMSDGETWPGEVIKGDRKKDLAIIRVKAEKSLVPAVLGNSRGLQVGAWVMAVGNPFGFENTITVGVISAVNRENVSSQIAVGLLQTDASINPGNDGGPLVNIKGEIIGVNTAIAADAQGIGFAVPINESRELYEDFI